MKQFFGMHLDTSTPGYENEMDKELFMFLHDFNRNLPDYKNNDNKYLKRISDLLSAYKQYYFEIKNHDIDVCYPEGNPFFDTSLFMDARVYIYDYKYELQQEVLKNIALYLESKFNVPILLCYLNLGQIIPDEDDGDPDNPGCDFAVSYYIKNETITKIAEHNPESEIYDEYLQKLDEGLVTPELDECEKKFEAELAEKSKKHDEALSNFLKEKNFTIEHAYTDEDFSLETASDSDGKEPDYVYYDDEDEPDEDYDEDSPDLKDISYDDCDEED